ncbi:MAG: hypothetical protein Q4A28_06150 [Brachymonas sp.]|nr:hypothetical protein [Brachymonas sp.]
MSAQPILLGPSLASIQLKGGGPLQKQMLPSQLLTRDVYRGGLGCVAGTVKELPKGAPEGSEVPVWRRVRLHDQATGNPIAETWSDPKTGAYRFEWVDMERVYTVMSYDHTGKFVAVAADSLKPERMEP